MDNREKVRMDRKKKRKKMSKVSSRERGRE